MTLTLPVDPQFPQPDVIARAAKCLREGGLVAFPTETVYGLGASALDPAAATRIFVAKKRPSYDPLIVHVAAAADVKHITAGIAAAAGPLMERFWPGPLTLVLLRGSAVPDAVTAGGSTVAVRLPAHPVARALIEAAGVPVAAPSANLFSRPSPTTAAHVLADLNGRIDMVLDGGPAEVGVESTVLDLTSDPPCILRPGAVTIEMLRRLLPSVVAGQGNARRGPAASPGLLDTHYAPRTPLTIFIGQPDSRRAHMLDLVSSAVAQGERVGALVSKEDSASFLAAGATVAVLSAEGDLPAAARRLYACLRKLDDADLSRIIGTAIPADERLGAALADRLMRAASGRIVTVN